MGGVRADAWPAHLEPIATEVAHRYGWSRIAHPDSELPVGFYWACAWPERPVVDASVMYRRGCVPCLIQAHADAVAHPDRPARITWDGETQHVTMREACELALGEEGIVLPLGARR